MEQIEIQERINDIMTKLIYINDQSGGIFDNTLIKDEDVEFASETPFYNLFRAYKIKLVGELETLEAKIREFQSFDDNMDLCFFIAAEHALLGDSVAKMKFYAGKLDWARWNPLKTGRAEIFQIHRDLYLRGREILKHT